MDTSSPVAFPVDNSQATFLDVPATSMVWDRVHQVIYAGVLNVEAKYPNSIVVIDPIAGQVQSVLSTGNPTYPPAGGPAALAISDDCNYLYAYIIGDAQPGILYRYNLPSMILDSTQAVSFGTDPTFGNPYYVGPMAVAPGAPHTLALIRWVRGFFAGVVILDDGVQRGPAALFTLPSVTRNLTSLEWRDDASALFLTDDDVATGEYVQLAVSSSGAAVQTDVIGALGFNPDYPGGHDIHWDPATGYLYIGNGQVLDPVTGHTVGTAGSGWKGMVPDLALGIGFYADPSGAGPAGTYSPKVHSYNLATFAPLATTTIPVLVIPNSPVFGPSNLLRCGPSLLALGGGPTGICLLTGPFAEGH